MNEIKKNVQRACNDYKKERLLKKLKDKYSWVVVVLICSIVLIPIAIVLLLYFELKLRYVGLFYYRTVTEYREEINNNFLEQYKKSIMHDKNNYEFYCKYYYVKKYNFNVEKFIQNNDYKTIYNALTEKNYFNEIIEKYKNEIFKNYDIFKIYLEIEYLINTKKSFELNKYKETLELLTDEEKKEFYKFPFGEILYNRIVK